jgi:hypothetical protein
MIMTKSPINIIIRAVGLFHDISELDIKGSSRLRPHVEARFEVCWLARQLTSLSTAEIGRALGGRDHSTVINAITATHVKFTEDVAYAGQLRHLRQSVGALIQEQAVEQKGATRAEEAEIDGLDVAKRVLGRGQTEKVYSQMEICRHGARAPARERGSREISGLRQSDERASGEAPMITPFDEANMTTLARQAMGKIDRRGPRGAEALSLEEITAMACLLACLGVSPILAGPAPSITK